MDERTDLLAVSPSGLKRLLAEWGEQPYRAGQIQHGIYRSLANEFVLMTDLPIPLRNRLQDSSRIGALAPRMEQSSADGLTRKVLFDLDDGQSLETVLMLYADAPSAGEAGDSLVVRADVRRTVCISTQVGCAIRCPFCATGQAGFSRNLNAGEIIGQVLYFARETKRLGYEEMPLTHVVIMGMGEPLLNFDATWQAIEALTDHARFGLGARRITVSTSGLIPGIKRLADKASQINLAVSLHAPHDELRNVLVPINRRYPLADLLEACRQYVARTRRRITFEYALMDGVNDGRNQARAVARLLQGLLCHVNLIPLNPTPGSVYRRPPYERVLSFERELRDAGIPVTMRVEKGIEIAAGCGQLRQAAAKPRSAGPASMSAAA